MVVLFRIYRKDQGEDATDFDMGDLEFTFNGHIVSSRGNSRSLNMIYLSVIDLIDGLLHLKNKAKVYRFVGADSSFVMWFKVKGERVLVMHEKNSFGPISFNELYRAIDSGLDRFLAEPRNHPPASGAIWNDLNKSRHLLKKGILQQ
jgi:hypothetical protein